MGLPGLWPVIDIQILEPAVQSRSLTQLAATEGFELNRRGKRGIVVGVDVSLWLWDVGVFQRNHARAGENPELRVLFYRLARLLRFALVVLFVFDGDARPSVKRGTNVITATPHWLTKLAQELISAFGFSWYTAPGEAEAELAWLNKSGIIDIILTDDSDVFLFGATHVMQNPEVEKHDDNKTIARLFTSEAIRASPSLGLTQGDYLLIAILSGGDYNKAGLEGCGIQIAIALSRSGFGTDLFEAASESDELILKVYLVQWRERVRNELRTNQNRHLVKRQLTLANKITESFPDPKVVLAYVNPLTSWSNGHSGPDISELQPPVPVIEDIAAFCQKKFSWGRDKVLTKFKNLLWGGACLAMLIETAVLGHTLGDNADPDFAVRKQKQCPPPGHSLVLYKLQFRPSAFVQRALTGLEPKLAHDSNLLDPDISSTWIPEPVLEVTVPETLQAFKLSAGALSLPCHPNPILSGGFQPTNNASSSNIYLPQPSFQASGSHLPIHPPEDVIVISDSEDDKDTNLQGLGKGKGRATSKVSRDQGGPNSEKDIIDLTTDES